MTTTSQHRPDRRCAVAAAARDRRTPRVDAGPRPFRRPRAITPARLVAWRKRRNENQGRCYEYAFSEAEKFIDAGSPRPTLRVVHGLVDGGRPHAWVERGGGAYDWQMLAAASGPRQPVPIAVFYDRHRPRETTVYTAREVMRIALRAKHYGPWKTSARPSSQTGTGACWPRRYHGSG